MKKIGDYRRKPSKGHRDKSRTPGNIHGITLENNQGIQAKAK